MEMTPEQKLRYEKFLAAIANEEIQKKRDAKKKANRQRDYELYQKPIDDARKERIQAILFKAAHTDYY